MSISHQKYERIRTYAFRSLNLLNTKTMKTTNDLNQKYGTATIAIHLIRTYPIFNIIYWLLASTPLALKVSYLVWMLSMFAISTELNVLSSIEHWLSTKYNYC